MRLMLALLFLAVQARAAILTVCPSGCTNTTIAAAYAAASSGDIIQLNEDIDSAVAITSQTYTAKTITIQGNTTTTARTWTYTGNSSGYTLRLAGSSGNFGNICIRNLTMRNGNTSATNAVIDIQNITAAGYLTITAATMYGCDNVDCGAIRNSANTSLTGVLITNSDFIGNGTDSRLIFDSANTTADVWKIINTIFRNNTTVSSYGTVAFIASTNNNVATIENCIFDNNYRGVGYGVSGPRMTITNCIFTRNSNADLFESGQTWAVSYSAFSSLTAHAGTGNIFGINTANQFVNIGTDYHPVSYAAGINTGLYIAETSPDKDGVTRSDPEEMGPYELTIPGPTPTPAPSSGNLPTSNSLMLMGIGL